MPSLHPRKTPRQARSLETVACILEAAAQLLESLGIAAFNTNAVAERAGVSIGSLYQYFPGKDALLVALMRREKERFRDDAAAALALPTGRAALDHLLRAAVRQQLDRPELARLLDIEEARPEAGRELAEVSGFRDIFRAVIARPDLQKLHDPQAAADDLIALVQALTDAFGARGDRDKAALERHVRGAVEGYLDAAACLPDATIASNASSDAPD